MPRPSPWSPLLLIAAIATGVASPRTAAAQTTAPAPALEAGDTAAPVPAPGGELVQPVAPVANTSANAPTIVPAAPAPVAPAAATAPLTPPPIERPARYYQRPWFWGAVFVVAMTALVITLVSVVPSDPAAPNTRLGDMRAF